jgi:hypothetical protein
MAVLAHQENGEIADWVDKTELDFVGIIIPSDETLVRCCPTISVDEYFKNRKGVLDI